MPLEIPKGLKLDGRIKPFFSVTVKQELVNRLEARGDIVYPVELVPGGVVPVNRSDVISPEHFRIIESEGQEIQYTMIASSMFGYSYIVNRGTMLNPQSLVNINDQLKAGKVSFCTVYDGLLLWEKFRKRKAHDDYWVGTEPFKTEKINYGIFKLAKDGEGKTCLLLGNMSSQVSFSSRCKIILRYQPN